MSDVGDGASLDFAVETIGFAKEDGGRGAAVGYGGDVHAYIIIQLDILLQACNRTNTCLHLTVKNALPASKQRDFPI